MLRIYSYSIQGSVIGLLVRLSQAVSMEKVKFSLEQAMKAQRGSRGIALLFL
jgi:hypothetical protein